jgi:hypothetical protein
MSKKTVIGICAAVSLVFVAFDAEAGRPASHPELSAEHSGGKTHAAEIISFDVMYGVDGPFIGDANSVRGVEGDELPWAIAGSIKGELETNGHLRIRVRGLVFKDDPSVPPALRGKNDETEFRGLVSCLSEGQSDTPVVNVTTPGFPATGSGDSTIDAVVELPNPCVAPVIMVLAGSEEKWFAITGFEREED